MGEREYWAVVVMLRKTALAALVAWPGVQQPWDQVYFGTWIMALSTVTHVMFVPYEHDKLQRIELCSLAAATAVFAMALYIPVDDDVRDIRFTKIMSTTIGIVTLFV